MGKERLQATHLLCMDDLKLLAKSYEKIDTLVRNFHVFSTDIGIKKCGILTMKRGEVV